MAISWLTAVKVVPWDKVLEHAPGVLDKARGFIDKHRTGGVEAPTELVQLAQQQMAQALAELAEQNAALIVAVRKLYVRLQFTNSNNQIDWAQARVKRDFSWIITGSCK